MGHLLLMDNSVMLQWKHVAFWELFRGFLMDGDAKLVKKYANTFPCRHEPPIFCERSVLVFGLSCATHHWQHVFAVLQIDFNYCSYKCD
uniref:Secreted protein n=1 Tax=Panagrellus redivivus TaxID=6233 RepID=A0A7E5A195_PANRE